MSSYWFNADAFLFCPLGECVLGIWFNAAERSLEKVSVLSILNLGWTARVVLGANEVTPRNAMTAQTKMSPLQDLDPSAARIALPTMRASTSSVRRHVKAGPGNASPPTVSIRYLEISRFYM